MIKVRAAFLSMAKLLSTDADEIRAELVRELIDILLPGLERYAVVWNPKVFKEALLNGDVPRDLLEKFDISLKTAVSMNWNIPVSLVEEIDRIVEDIESFNPKFRNSISPKSNGKTSAPSRIKINKRK